MQRILHQSVILYSRHLGLETQASCRAVAALQCRHASAAAEHQAPEPYDVVVFGGGMVGIAFAALLGAQPPEVVHVPPQPPKVVDVPYRVRRRISAQPSRAIGSAPRQRLATVLVDARRHTSGDERLEGRSRRPSGEQLDARRALVQHPVAPKPDNASVKAG